MGVDTTEIRADTGENQSPAPPPSAFSARPLPAEAGAAAFRRAAAGLGGADPDTTEARRHAASAARCLAGLAEAGDDAALRADLRPDPAAEAAAWTVACYQIGDLTPSALRDFSDPVQAVATLASCGEASHLAAELLVSTDDGLRWTAMVRTGSDLAFQLLGAQTCVGDPDGARLRAVRRAGEDRVLQWSVEPLEAAPVTGPGAGTGVPPAHQPAAATPGGAGPDGVAAAPSWTALRPFPRPSVAEIVDELVAAVRQLPTPPADPALAARMERIESRLEELTRAVGALGTPTPVGWWGRRRARRGTPGSTIDGHIRPDAAPAGRQAAIDVASSD